MNPLEHFFDPLSLPSDGHIKRFDELDRHVLPPGF